MMPFLPPEILEGIFDQLKYTNHLHYDPSEEIYTEDLASCCLASKFFLPIVRPRLYQSITVLLMVAQDCDWDEPQYLIEQRERRLLRTLRQNFHLADMVEKVVIEGVECDEWWLTQVGREVGDGDTPYELIGPLVEDLPNVRSITVQNLSTRCEVDEALCSAQERRWNSCEVDHKSLPQFNLDEGNQSEETLSAVYHGYKCPDLVLSCAEWETVVEASHITLRNLSIILDDSTDLSNFRYLERLTLELSGLNRYPNQAIGVDHNLLNLLARQSTPSLRTLVLRSYISPNELSNLLRTGSLATALPPSLTHISIHVPADPSDILIFIRSLPSTTRLERLNYWGERGEEEEVNKACKERGIRLSLKQKWDIWW